jgi:Ca-activated chloride channel family protein
MTVQIVGMSEAEATRVVADQDAGLGALHTHRGNLPLDTIEVQAAITGLVARTTLTQGYRNPFDTPLEATYVFPLPDRAAVTGMQMTADDRVVQAELRERGQARQAYDQAIAEGRRASIAEEERPDVFTMRVGNILPGERVSVMVTFVGPLPYEDGEATYRLPLVVAPRYIPGTPLPGPSVGDGYAQDTDAVPDASRITPPVLLPGFPNPVRLSLDVDLDPAGLPLTEVRSSLHTVVREGGRVSLRPGERVNRDFVLRLAYGSAEDEAHSLTLTPDDTEQGDASEGTFRLTILPPTGRAPSRPRNLVLVLDRSGSMAGWKMVAARRAAARIVDTLAPTDRFAVLTFDNAIERPPALGSGLAEANDRHRFRAVEHLARTEARGGTEILAPLREALALLAETTADRDPVLVLVTDGQVGNEDQILAEITSSLRRVRMHTVGIDQAVNAGFLGRLAAAGAGRCELVESEDRLDAAMERIHRRIGAPLVTGLALAAEGVEPLPETITPARLPDLFAGAPLVVSGRYRTSGGHTSAARSEAAMTVRGNGPEGEWSIRVPARQAADPALTAVWARAYLRDLEDRYVAEPGAEGEQRIVAASLRFGVLCRFTAWLAVDTRIVAEGGQVHRVVQPVEVPAGWEMLADSAPAMRLAASTTPAAYAPRGFAPPTVAGGRLQAKRGRGIAMPRPGMLRRQPPVPVRESATTAPPGELAVAGRQAGEEAARLRAAQALPVPERRQLLADVVSRIAALLRQLERAGAEEGVLAPIRELVTELDEDRALAIAAERFDQAWERTLAVLDALATGSTPTEPTTVRPTRREFWKR